jgi:hypothetical protein
MGPITTFNFYKHVPPTQNVRQQIMYAEWYARYYIACLASGVKNFFAYVFSTPNFWAPDYSLNNIDGRLGPNLTAISALAWQVDGTNFSQTVTLSDGARAEIFEGSGRAVACILPLPGKARTLPSDPAIEAYDLFGNLLAPGTKAPAGVHYLQTTKPAA